MKRLIGLILALSMVLTLALPAFAEEACTTEGCTLALGHEGDCQLEQSSNQEDAPQPCTTKGCTLPLGHSEPCNAPTTCQVNTDCILGYDHDGDCQLKSQPCSTKGCTLPLGHSEPCNAPTNCQLNGDCILGYGHEGDCQLKSAETPCDTQGCPLLLGHEGEHAFPPAQNGPASEPGAGDPIEMGFCFSFTTDTGRDFVKSPLQIPVGKSEGANLYFGGQPLTTMDGITYDSGLTVTLSSENVFFFAPSEAKDYTITYTDETQGTHTLTVTGVDDSIPEKAFCFAYSTDHGIDAFTRPLRIPLGGKDGVMLFYNGKQLSPADPVTVTPAEGLGMTRFSNGGAEFTANALGTYTLSYTPDGKGPQTLTVECYDPNAIAEEGFCFVLDLPDGIKILTDALSLNEGGSASVRLFHQKTQITDSKKITVSDGLTMTVDSNGYFTFKPEKPGVYTVTYRVTGNEQYTLEVVCTARGRLQAKAAEGELSDTLTIIEEHPMEVELYANGQKVTGQVTSNGSMLEVANNAGTYTLTGFMPGEYQLSYRPTRYEVYTLDVICQPTKRLALEVGGEWQFDLTCQVGDSVDVKVLFGYPSEDFGEAFGELTTTDGISLEPNGKGGHTLTANAPGDHTITTVVEGETFSFHVTVLPEAQSGGSFFALEGISGAPQFFSSVVPDWPTNLRLCYGSYGNYTVIDPNDPNLKLEGDSVALRSDNGYAVLTYQHSGQTLIQYTDATGIVHNFAVMAYGSSDDSFHSWYQDQTRVLLPYGGETLMVGFSRMSVGGLLDMVGGYGVMTSDKDEGMDESIFLGAMAVDSNGHASKEPPMDFFGTLSNAHFSWLSGGFGLENGLSLDWKTVKLPAARVTADPGDYGYAQVLATFDMTRDGATHRFYRTTDVRFEYEPVPEIQVDIEDAKVLNTLLSDIRVLKNYLGDQYTGGPLILELPAVTYEAPIVSQIMLGGDDSHYFAFSLRGTGQGKDRTTMPGLLSKGGLGTVSNIQFTAVNSAKLPCDGKDKTCGILMDNCSDYKPHYDRATLVAYHPDFQNKTPEQIDELFKNYNPQPNAAGTASSIARVENCGFEGFEYGTYSGTGGYAGYLEGCTLERCKYGVYINCTQTANPNNGGTKLYRFNNFNDNWCNVRIVSLPDGLTPYYVRFQDNWLRRGHLDFWVDQKGSYYFYRNYFDGTWNNDPRNDWEPDSIPKARATAEGVRGAAILAQGDSLVVSNPCRKTELDDKNLWIFDTDDAQNTRIFQSESADLQVDPSALSQLTTNKLEIPILDDQQNTIGSWIVKGGTQ